jgi:16S rRNA processing protein RimM
LGQVSDLMATGPNSVLVIAYTDTIEGVEQALERMVPFVAAYVDEVNTAQRRITVDWQPDY